MNKEEAIEILKVEYLGDSDEMVVAKKLAVESLELLLSQDRVFETYCDTCARKKVTDFNCYFCKRHELVPFDWLYDFEGREQLASAEPSTDN